MLYHNTQIYAPPPLSHLYLLFSFLLFFFFFLGGGEASPPLDEALVVDKAEHN